MCTATAPLSASDKFALVESLLAELAGEDAAVQPVAVMADGLRALERIDAAGAAVRARLLHGFDAQQGSMCDGQRTTRTWLVNCLRVTKGQTSEYKAIQALAAKHEPLLAGLRDRVLTKSLALLLARWTMAIPEEFRAEGEEIVVTAARTGAACHRWPRSAPRSANAPRRPTRATTRTMTPGWTAPWCWTPRSTVSGCCAAT